MVDLSLKVCTWNIMGASSRRLDPSRGLSNLDNNLSKLIALFTMMNQDEHRVGRVCCIQREASDQEGPSILSNMLSNFSKYKSKQV